MVEIALNLALATALLVTLLIVKGRRLKQ